MSALVPRTWAGPAVMSYERRKTWCDGCDVYVWLWSTQGVSVLVASGMSSAVPILPSGPGWSWARVRAMNCWPGGTSSPVFGTPSGPSVISGSSARSGTNTVPLDFTVWSTPWSKNWPKNVNHELNGGDRPTSVEMFGMKRVLCSGVQPAGTFGAVHTNTRSGFACVRTGFAATSTAAGFVDVWSSIRFEISRGCVSNTMLPARWFAYVLDGTAG